MMKMAVRIRDRAIRRAGELLKQFEPGQGARDGEVARNAGLSPHQQKQAIPIRVANVPEAEFERQVES